MFSKLLSICAVVLPLGLIGSTPVALADTNVDIHFGVPFYSYQVRPYYRYRRDYGWYDAYRYPRFRGGAYYDDDDSDYVASYPGRLTCGEARRLVREHGFYHVLTRDCYGRIYAFDGLRNDHWATIFVNPYSGRVWRD